jgi:hypothetical protein
MKHACNITLVAAFSCAASVAAQPAVDARIAECAAIESAVARLDCFDALATRVRAAGAAANEAVPQTSGAPENGAAVTATQAPSRVVTGAPAEPERAHRPARREARGGERGEQIGHVASLRQIQPGRVEVTLTNGEIWRQTNSDRYHLLVGHEVKIYPTGFGQYFRLSSTEARGFIQVERVR